MTDINSNLSSTAISRRQFVSRKDVIHSIPGKSVFHVFIFIFSVVQPVGADVSRQRSAKAMEHSTATKNATTTAERYRIRYSALPPLRLLQINLEFHATRGWGERSGAVRVWLVSLKVGNCTPRGACIRQIVGLTARLLCDSHIWLWLIWTLDWRRCCR